MCDRRVLDTVKDRMLSRRDLFKNAGIGAAATAVPTTALTTPAMAQGHGKVVDLTHELHEEFPTFSGKQQFFREQLFNWNEHKFNLFEIRFDEHTGTHMDAPLHFSASGESVAEIPVASLICPLCVFDIRDKAAANADAQVTPNDVEEWIAANGEIPENACVAMNSGWDKYVSTEKFRNVGTDGKMHFPGFHIEAARMLMETGAIGMAVDTLSIDYGMSGDFATHYSWLSTGRWGLECVANLDLAPASGATLIAGAPKHRGGSGGPARIMAIV
jgi:kynurenine formamidase